MLLGDSGIGKSSIIIRYTQNQFSQNLMNSIGVDFKLKNIVVDDKNIKLQIVYFIYFTKYSGTPPVKNASERLIHLIIKVRKLLS